MSNTRIDNNNTELQSILDTINALPDANEGGTDTSDATATASDILNGKTAYVNGEKITGNIAFQAAKTITPSTTNQIAISAGYYASGSVTVKGDSNLVARNIKSGTSIFGVTGTYEGSGGSGDGSNNVLDDIIERTITEISNDRVIYIGTYAFYNCRSLTSVNFPACKSIGSSAFCTCISLTSVNFPVCTSIGSSAFYNCRSLTSVNFPACKSIGSSAFCSCRSLTSVNFPVCTSIGSSAFCSCRSLTSVNFPACKNIGSSAFYNCLYLTNLTLGASRVATLSHINAFYSTPMSISTLTGTFGSIYVPASLVTTYQSATNWATYSSRITAMVEDSGGDTGGTNTITFTIDGVPQLADEGMTWTEWLESNYNTDGFYDAGGVIIGSNDAAISRTESVHDVIEDLSETIIANHQYYTVLP